jgi:tricorn protease
MKKLSLLLTVLFLSGQILLSQETRLLRYPNTSESQVSFVYGGDVYVAPITGGQAQRLTTSEGLERFPRFSPDGKTLAFTAEYDGNNEIYTMNLNNNSNLFSPKRITYSYMESGTAERQGPDKIIMQFSNDGNKILYRSRHEGWSLNGTLYFINKDGGIPEQLPVPRGGFASLSPDNSKMAYNRIFREFRTWKRYSGGQADDIRIYDLKTGNSENITNNKFQDIIPIWAGNKIYYLSDRDFTMNLFCYDLTTKQTKKITNFNEFDVKFPSLGAKHIAFENGGYIYLMDLATEQIKKLDISIVNDLASIRPSIENVKNRITSSDLSPTAKRAIFSARGNIYSVPASKGNIDNLTNESGVHNRSCNWSPDGKWISYISDKSGTDEIYLMKPDGSDKMQLTSNGKFYRYDAVWSPDSKMLLTYDNTRALNIIDITTKKQTLVAKSKTFPISDFNWSPDSKWVAYSESADAKISQLKIYSIAQNKSYPVTSEMYNSYNPKFTPGGNFLLFISDRNFQPSIGNFEYNYQYSFMSNIYGITLQDSTLNPFTVFENDEESADDESKKKKDKKDTPVEVNINFTGIQDRIFKVPTASGNYSSLVPLSTHKLYYTRDEKDKPRTMFYYDFVAKEEKEVGAITNFSISNDEKSIFFRSGADFYITKLTEKITPKEGKLDLSQMTTVLDKQAEWRQIYNES